MTRVRSMISVLATAAVVNTLAASVGPARAEGDQSTWWDITSQVLPSRLIRNESGQEIIIRVANVGYVSASGTTIPITLAATLPAGIEATSISATAGFEGIRSNEEENTPGEAKPKVTCDVSGGMIVCSFGGTLPPYEDIELTIGVTVAALAHDGAALSVQVAGGNTTERTMSRPLAVGEPGEASSSFGIEEYGFDFRPEADNGEIDTQGGSHPFQLTTNLALAEKFSGGTVTSPEPPRNISVDLPSGVVGDAQATAQCTVLQFTTAFNGINECPSDTAVGVAAVTISDPPAFGTPEPITDTVPVFNLTPFSGEPATFGMEVAGVLTYLETRVATGRDGHVTVAVSNISQSVTLLASTITLWGDPADPRHDSARGWQCVADERFDFGGRRCENPSGMQERPLVRMPTGCKGFQPLMEAEAWAAPGLPSVPSTWAYPQQQLEGGALEVRNCAAIPFEPQLKVQYGVASAASPTEVDVHLKIPEEVSENPNGLAEADVKSTTVTLPAGLQINAAAAAGLSGCTEKDIGYEATDENGQLRYTEESEAERTGETPHEHGCPEASKLGTVEVTTPLLKEALKGYVYQAAQGTNPFGSLLALYVIAEAPNAGVRIRLAGEVKADPATGQLTSTFPHTPQLPFEEFQLKFFGGDKAALATTSCGTYRTESSIEPWSGTPAVHPFSQFDVSTGPEGSAAWCQSPPFAPSFTAGTTNNAAGAFSPFTFTLARSDADQTLSTVATRLPLGLAGEISKVTPCGEPEAQSGACPAASQIGHVIVQAGVGKEPITLPEAGQPQDPVYLTGPYEGAPFGLTVVVPAKAGPFDLDQGGPPIVVRAKIGVDQHTAQVTVVSDPMPQMIHSTGIPSDVRAVDIVIDHPEFTFNPTSCEPTAVSGTIASAQGAVANVSSRFQAAECRSMPFKPGFSVLTHAAHSKADGEYLHVVVTSRSGQANVRSVHVAIPKTLPARLSTLNHACSEAQFATNPAGCPASSFVGTAIAYTPVLPVPLTGPAIFVSHGGAAFPDLDLVLQGDGVTLVLTGNTFIDKAGVTSSTFASVPDVPFTRFDLILPPGPHSALTAEGDLCVGGLSMPTTIAGQNGALVRQSTRIGVLGCKPALRVLRHSTSGATATISVHVPSAGRVLARGANLSRVVTRMRKAGVATLQLRLSERAQRLLARHRGRRLKTRVQLVFTPAHGRRLTDAVTVLMS